MPIDLIKNQNEFFIALGDQEGHSFIMLGVIINGSPLLMMRVGKIMDVDSISVSNICELLQNKCLSRIADEGIARSSSIPKPISYQAYSINYEQLKEFMSLILEVEKKGLQNIDIREGMIRFHRKEEETDEEVLLRKAIWGYVPILEDGDKVTIEYIELRNCNLLPQMEGDITPIIESTQRMRISNTCRTTSLSIIERILGFNTHLSKHFFIAPKFQTTLVKGQPHQHSFFYILPSPHKENRENLTDEQYYLLNRLYKKLKQVPDLNPQSPQTHAKFEALKSIYKKIAGENNLSVDKLMERIHDREDNTNQALFVKREPHFLSKFFSLLSSTERMFNDIEKDLQWEIIQNNANKLITRLQERIYELPVGNPQRKNIRKLLELAETRLKTRMTQQEGEMLRVALEKTDNFLRGNGDDYRTTIETVSKHIDSFPWFKLLIGILLLITAFALLVAAASLVISLTVTTGPFVAIVAPVAILFKEIIAFIASLSIAHITLSTTVATGVVVVANIVGATISGIPGVFFMQNSNFEKCMEKIATEKTI